MQGDRIAMSQRERDVLKVMSGVLRGERSQVEASRLLGRSVRQVRRIQRRLEGEGDEGVIHRLRGRRSNRRKDEGQRERVLEVYREEYGDFGPTLAAEKLAARGLRVVPETLRRWLMAAGLWERRRRRERHRQRRARRECFGELVQLDASLHDWTEGRGEAMVLVVLIDDATNRVLARFYPAETTEAYMELLGRWLKRYGRPLAVYSDRDSIFEAQSPSDPDYQGQTQFGRALGELGIEGILAYSPQAKGRVERFFALAQDRWVKEMRLAGVKTLGQANALLRRLVPQYNRRFTVQPVSPNDAHRPLGPGQNPAAILSLQSQRRVGNDYTVRFQNRVYQLAPPAWPGLRGGKVTLELRLDDTLAIRFRDHYLQFHEIAANGSKLGALPPGPRSLALCRPNGCGKKRDRASGETRSAATRPTAGRSGRTPAEPYPPDGTSQRTTNGRYRPPPSHPWRRTFLSRKKADISIVV